LGDGLGDATGDALRTLAWAFFRETREASFLRGNKKRTGNSFRTPHFILLWQKWNDIDISFHFLNLKF
jgi:hypothetical protein